jgi:hypothetical protein
MGRNLCLFAGNLKFGRWENIFNPAGKHQDVVFKVFNHRDVMKGEKTKRKQAALLAITLQILRLLQEVNNSKKAAGVHWQWGWRGDSE